MPRPVRRLYAVVLVAVLTLSTGMVARSQAGTELPMSGMASTPETPPMTGMAGMSAAGPPVPPVAGYAEGEEILFIHTEASDPTIATMLTDMMGGSPVLLVPSLAQASEAMLANVYVFTNGVMTEEAMGPMGFQPDVFDRPPGDSGYSPLRRVQLVTWADEATARVLTSAAEVEIAARAGELTVEPTGVVVNMPFLTWPGGHR